MYWAKLTHPQLGFTLLELLVVISLMTLVIGITAANFQRGTPTAELKSESRKLVSLLRQTRSRAMSESRILGFIADGEGRGYRLTPKGNVSVLPDGMDLSVNGENPHTGIKPEEILFFPDGSSSGGQLHILSSVGERTIEVNWLTGEVSLVDPPQ